MKVFQEQKYSPEVVLEKSWFQKFQKIHLKETVMKSPFSNVAAWNFIKKELHHSYFPMTLTNKIFQNSCPEEHLQTCLWRNDSHT